jgi:hypothetical protein
MIFHLFAVFLLGFLGLTMSTNVVPPKFNSNLNETVSTQGWISYKQCDSRWANQGLGSSTTKSICSAQDSPMVSVCMMLKTKGQDFDPSTFDAWLSQNNGYSNDSDFIWNSISVLKVSFQGINKYTEQEICDELSYKHGVIAHITDGHWVLLTGCVGNGVFTANDPSYSTSISNFPEIVEVAVYY